MKLLPLFMVLLFLSSCNPEKAQYEEKCKSNIEITSRYFTEIYNQDKMELVDELFIDDYSHINSDGRSFTGTGRLKEAISRVKSFLPNLEVEITEVVADTSKVIFLSTFISDLPEIANPETTAENISFNEIFIFWVKDGKIYKGRTAGAHLPMIKQASGFEGTIPEIIEFMSGTEGSGKIEM